MLLLLAANILGLTSYFLSDKQQRRAFLETRQSLEMKMLIEEQSAEQVGKSRGEKEVEGGSFFGKFKKIEKKGVFFLKRNKI